MKREAKSTFHCAARPSLHCAVLQEFLAHGTPLHSAAMVPFSGFGLFVLPARCGLLKVVAEGFTFIQWPLGRELEHPEHSQKHETQKSLRANKFYFPGELRTNRIEIVDADADTTNSVPSQAPVQHGSTESQVASVKKVSRVCFKNCFDIPSTGKQVDVACYRYQVRRTTDKRKLRRQEQPMAIPQ